MALFLFIAGLTFFLFGLSKLLLLLFLPFSFLTILALLLLLIASFVLFLGLFRLPSTFFLLPLLMSK
jgi:hypothetical protein